MIDANSGLDDENHKSTWVMLLLFLSKWVPTVYAASICGLGMDLGDVILNVAGSFL